MDANEFRAEIASIFKEQDRRMERLDNKIERNAEAIERNAKAIDKNSQAINKLTGLWTDFVETYL